MHPRTTGRPTPTRPARLLATVVVGLLAAVAVGLPGWLLAPASAHDALVGSTPRDGAELASSPPSVVLTFSEEVSKISPQIVLQDADGEVVSDEEPTVDGIDVTAPLPALDDGDYTVVWRVVSADGHPVDGTIDFSVDAGDAGGGGATTEPTTEPSQEPTSAPSDAPTSAAPSDGTPSASAGDDASPTSAAAETDDGTDWTVPIVIGVVVVLVAGALLAWPMLRKRG